jgi:protein-tyrosine phosphatase
MVDIHCHILPQLDDGAESMETACAMAEMAIEDGITHVIGTPHASPSWKFDPEIVKQRRDELQGRFEGRLTLGTGCDFHLSYENLQDIRHDSWRYTLNQKNYLLIEFADFAIPPSLDHALHELQLTGITPIVTHPERNPLIRTQPQRLDTWLRQGCYAQVTAQSVLGRFGATAEAAAKKWINEGRVHFLASDAHNTTGRPLQLKEAFDYVSKQWGKEMAQGLLVGNPLAAFEGRALPFVPDLPEQEDGQNPAEQKKKRRFWFF